MLKHRAVIAPVLLAFWLAAPASPLAQEQEPFTRELEWRGERFNVTATNAGSINELTITPPAALSAQKPIKREIEGRVAGAEIDDLDNNRRPEIYIYVNSAGSGGYGNVIAYEVDKSGRRLRPVTFNPELTGKASNGYMGHDDFALVEGTLVRRFQLYRPGDTNAAPSGGMRQLQYKLRQGPRGPRLVLDKSLSY
jgi:hypothetical protein